MWWFVGFVVLLGVALPLDIRFRWGRDNTEKVWTWDGPRVIGSIFKRVKQLFLKL